MEINVQDRKSELEGLNIFLSHITTKLHSITEALGWDASYLEKKRDTLKKCPLDSGHRMPKPSWEKHVETCAWKKEGYVDDVPLSEPCHSKSTVFIGPDIQAQIFYEAAAKDPTFVAGANISCTPPKSSNRLIASYTRSERLALYNYAVSKAENDVTIPGELPVSLQLSEETKKSKTLLEILAEERNAKRRRAKYKSVHTNRKSQVEVLREVIANQMEMLFENCRTSETSEVESLNDKIKKEFKTEKSSEKEIPYSHDNEKYTKKDESYEGNRKARDKVKTSKESKYGNKHNGSNKYVGSSSSRESSSSRSRRDFKTNDDVDGFNYDRSKRDYVRKRDYKYREHREDDEFRRKRYRSRSVEKYDAPNRR